MTGEDSNDFLDVCKDTESTLTECECKDSSNSDATINRSDQSFRRSKYVVCDSMEKPCSTIYPSKIHSKSDSDEWSSKSICSSRNDDYASLDRQRGIVLCDKKPEFDYNNYCKEETRRKFPKVCRCRKQNREPIGDGRCSCGEKRRRVMEKENFVQPLSTCSCIAEEEEEDVCEDVETCKKSVEEPVNVCRNASKSLEPVEKFVECTKKSAGKLKEEKEKEKEIEQIDEDIKTKETEEEKKENLQKMPAPPSTPQKLIRPEALALKNILKQQNKPAAQTNTNPSSVTKTNSPENKTNPSSNNPNNPQTKAEPAFLKKFNLKDQYKFMKKSEVDKKQTPSQKPEDKTQEVKENEEDKGGRKSFQEKVKNTLLYKSLRKVLEKKESPERKSKEEDKVGEDTKDSTDKKARVDGDRSPKDSKDTKEKEKFIPRINVYKMMKGKKNKQETNTSQKTSENDADSKPVESIKIEKEKKDVKEETSDIKEKEKEEKAKISTTVVSKKPSPPLIKDTKIEEMKRINPEKSEKVSEPRDLKKIEPGPSKDPEIRQKLDDRQTKKPETLKSVMEEKPIKIDPPSDAPTVCTQCVRRKSLNQESKQCSQIRAAEPHTTCVNPSFIRCTDINENCTVGNESRCNCCYLPMSQSTNECVNHPKSCLKKERQFRCPNSQETSASIPCYDKRNWAECGCRRVLCCEGCRRPRTECRYASPSLKMKFNG